MKFVYFVVITTLLSIIIVLLGLIFFTVVYSVKNECENDSTTFTSTSTTTAFSTESITSMTTDGSNPQTTTSAYLDDELIIVTREEWNAKEIDPRSLNDTLDVPLSRIVIIHTASETCATREECIEYVKYVENLHIGPPYYFYDIGYNFLIGGDGAVYEGMGWDLEGTHTYDYNSISFGIAYIGTFTDDLPNEKQLKAGFLLFERGVELGKLSEDYKIFAHRQLTVIESPGRKFYELIQTWDRWSEEI